jgi:hypothetical protein
LVSVGNAENRVINEFGLDGLGGTHGI